MQKYANACFRTLWEFRIVTSNNIRPKIRRINSDIRKAISILIMVTTTSQFLRDCIQVYLMYSLSGEWTTILITSWWWRHLRRLAVSKQATQKLQMKRCNLKKLNEIECKEEYQLKSQKRFVHLENLDDEVIINRAWETNRDNIKISVFMPSQNNVWLLYNKMTEIKWKQ
jgi:hypothetical protein